LAVRKPTEQASTYLGDTSDVNENAGESWRAMNGDTNGIIKLVPPVIPVG
jgi:hypothetical protein